MALFNEKILDGGKERKQFYYTNPSMRQWRELFHANSIKN